MSPNLESLRAHRLQIDEISRRYGVSHTRVFGSVARGTANEASDVDFLVEMESSRSLLDLVGFEQDLSDELAMRVDVVVDGGINPFLEPVIVREAFAL